MSKKKIWVGTNWKMTKTAAEGVSYAECLVKESKKISPAIELFIIPSYTSLVPIEKVLRGTDIYLGAQNMHWEDEGAYTGEISPTMLDEINVNIIELGHSERRQYYNEDNHSVNKKVIAALQYGMKPLICIGESLNQINDGIAEEVLTSQLKICLKGVTKNQAKEILIAYEPIWAIGESGIAPDKEYISKKHEFLRSKLRDIFGDEACNIPLLYGGSVNLDNCRKYMQLKEVDGLFIGRSAWDIGNFTKIIEKIEKVI